MSQIREDTDWSDPVASKKANEQIKKLSKQLMMSRVNKNPTNQTDSVNAELQKENIENISKTWNQMMESAKLGEEGDIFLGKPVRDEIIEEFKEDEKIKIGSILSNELETLVIDMSVKGIEVLIDYMGLFKSIKILVITGGQNNVPADLPLILKNAVHYPLSALYIINFQTHIGSIPAGISSFPNLDTLGLFNNNLKSLSTSVDKLKKLKVLYLDNNPISTVYTSLSKLKNLEKLGLINTAVTEAEALKIKQLLPNCEVFTK
jgi:Leucine-rich repeat (LRR) protein